MHTFAIVLAVIAIFGLWTKSVVEWSISAGKQELAYELIRGCINERPGNRTCTMEYTADLLTTISVGNKILYCRDTKNNVDC